MENEPARATGVFSCGGDASRRAPASTQIEPTQDLSIEGSLLADITSCLGKPPNVRVVHVGSGQNNVVYDVDGDLVRIPRHAEADRDLEREVRVLSVLGALLPAPVPCPTLHRLGNRQFAVHPRLAGEPLTTLDGLNGKRRRILAADLDNFLSALHAVPVSVLPDRTTDPPSREWQELLSRCEASAFPILSPDVVSGLRRSFDAFLGVCDMLPRCIVHGDFGTGNILVSQARLAGVIDFSGCHVGDPAYDYASLAAGLGDAFVGMMPRFSKQELRDRMHFYRCTFPLLDILYGVEHGDREALDAGVQAFSL